MNVQEARPSLRLANSSKTSLRLSGRSSFVGARQQTKTCGWLSRRASRPVVSGMHRRCERRTREIRAITAGEGESNGSGPDFSMRHEAPRLSESRVEAERILNQGPWPQKQARRARFGQLAINAAAFANVAPASRTSSIFLKDPFFWRLGRTSDPDSTRPADSSKDANVRGMSWMPF